MVKLKRRFGAPLVCFGPHASAAPTESMEHAPDVDAMIVGEPEDAVVALARLESLDGASDIPGVVLRRNGTVLPHTGRGVFTGFLDMPTPAWDLLPLKRYRLPLVNEPYVLIETSRGCPYSCDFCVVPLHHGHKFRERSAKVLVDEIAQARRDHGIRFFYLWGDTVTLNAKTFSQFCEELIARNLDIRWFANARADNLVDLEFVKRLKRSGLLDALDGHRVRVGRHAQGHDEAARAPEDPDGVHEPARSRDQVVRVLHLRVPGRDAGVDGAERPGTRSSSMPTSRTSTRRCRTRAPRSTRRRSARAGSPPTTGPGWSTRTTCSKGNGLDERVVMAALNRARRRFFLRPSYIARHLGDIFRMLLTSQALVWKVVTRMLIGERVRPVTGD